MEDKNLENQTERMFKKDYTPVKMMRGLTNLTNLTALVLGGLVGYEMGEAATQYAQTLTKTNAAEYLFSNYPSITKGISTISVGLTTLKATNLLTKPLLRSYVINFINKI